MHWLLAGIRQKSQARIRMYEPTISQSQAVGKVPLITQRTVTEPPALITGRQHQAEARRKCGECLFIQKYLVSVVEQDIAYAIRPVTRLPHNCVRHRITELMGLPVGRPFLGKREVRSALSRPGKVIDTVDRVKNVLDDPRLLI